jgi:hypothetical protein
MTALKGLAWSLVVIMGCVWVAEFYPVNTDRVSDDRYLTFKVYDWRAE